MANWSVWSRGAVAASVVLLTLVACDAGPTAPSGPPEVQDRLVRAVEGDTLELTARGRIDGWRSTDPAVAEVSAGGRVTARGPGWAVLVAEGPEGADSVFVGVGVRFASVVATDVSTCGLDAQGTAYCWGSAYPGVLGNGEMTTTRRTPVRVAGTVRFRVLSAGGSHVCGISTEGAVYCWGSNDWGQIGNGVHGLYCPGNPDACAPVPVRVSLRGPAVSVAAGWDHSCAALEGGAVHCWGAGSAGQLGFAADTLCGTWRPCSPLPARVPTGAALERVAAGYGITCALTPQGEPHCWGYGDAGQLGRGNAYFSQPPGPVSTPLRMDTLATAADRTCGIASGRVYCWGSDRDGGLGVGGALERCGTTSCATTPRPVASDSSFVAIAVGLRSCAVTTGGSVMCWGPELDRSAGSSVPAPIATDLRFRAVAVGAWHACGVLRDGGAACWGESDATGTGSPPRMIPVLVAPPGPIPGELGGAR